MYVVGFDGKLGVGKTFGMSLLAQHYRQKTGCTLYSNYGLKNSKLFTNFEQFLDVAQQPSSIICLDEAHTDLDARSGNTNAVKYFTHLLFYLRKIRATLFFTTPDISTVDFRVRSIMNAYCNVRKNKSSFYYDFWEPNTGHKLRGYKIDQQRAFAISSQVYDTHKMVVPMDFPETKQDYSSLINQLKSISDDYYIRQLTDAPRAQHSEAVSV